MIQSSEEYALDVQGLSKVYVSGERQLTVLADVSFALAKGSTASIVGPSGSGKTTLLGLSAGLDSPSRGSVTLNGVRLELLDEEARAQIRSQYVGFVFQTFQLLSTLTAIENVMIPLELRGERNAGTAAKELLARVGLSERLGHYPAQLSGGEQQRVALARAFVNQPTVLFADEPTGNLDAETGAVVEDLLFELNRESGTTLLLVTHNLDLAARTDRIISLKGGRVVSDTSKSPEIQTETSGVKNE